MASKKGIAITVAILAAITGASFLLWMIPQGNESTFVISDYKNYLDGVKNIHEVLQESIDEDFQDLVDGKITPDEYITTAEITSTQVTAKISEFVMSKPPEPWQESYIKYMDALKKFNSYIIETKVYANMVKEDAGQKDMSEILQKIEKLKEETKNLIENSDRSRP
jgi:hypothetical protein